MPAERRASDRIPEMPEPQKVEVVPPDSDIHHSRFFVSTTPGTYEPKVRPTFRYLIPESSLNRLKRLPPHMVRAEVLRTERQIVLYILAWAVMVCSSVWLLTHLSAGMLSATAAYFLVMRHTLSLGHVIALVLIGAMVIYVRRASRRMRRDILDRE